MNDLTTAPSVSNVVLDTPISTKAPTPPRNVAGEPFTSRRDYLEHLEATDPVRFMKEIENFNAGEEILCKDTVDGIIDAMFADADVIDQTLVDGNNNVLPGSSYAQRGRKVTVGEIAVCLLFIVAVFVWAVVQGAGK